MTHTGVPSSRRCSLPAAGAELGVIRNLWEHVPISADYSLRRDDREALLQENEIILLQDSGGDLIFLDELNAAGDSADDITTGFVYSYLDTPSIKAAYPKLHGLFPALIRWIDLPRSLGSPVLFSQQFLVVKKAPTAPWFGKVPV
ncbi:hypothetical protein BDD14_1793 [Edaphobacter modestus]|uniref:Uncharacterized protein n=1 Tax=Edaphobacter modestus TaxID=388466 RepID=A0A4Q7YRC9_9BACT|nr:hypothetical protein BDD14_1793 [Edaphobacter modestus]